MSEVNILLLGAGKRVSFARHLKNEAKNRGLLLKIYSYELDYTVPIACEAEIVIGKKWSDKDILEDIEFYIGKYSIDMVLPFVDPATLVASDLKERGNTSAVIPVSNRLVAEVFFDKSKASHWFSENNIQHPKESLSPPLIIKPIFGSASKGIIFIDNEDELNSYSAALKTNNYICEKRIYGIEYTVDAYIWNEKLIYCVPRKRVETSGGESTKTVTCRKPSVTELVSEIALKSNLKGHITLQFIEEELTGEVYFFEINPRFGGAVICSIGAGVNIPKILMDTILGEQVVPVNNWSDGLMMSRYFSEVFINADNY